MIYQFKVWFEDNDEILRKIEVKTSTSFENLHNAIQDSIGFDKMQMASFYICDENWNKGMEITQFDMTDLSEDMDSEEIDLESIKPIMADSRIADFIKEPLQKIIYVYDFIEMWTFKIQLLGIKDEIKGILYPRIAESVGEAPSQHRGTESFKLLDDLEMDEIAEQIKQEYTGGPAAPDPYGEDDVDPDIMEEFNDLY